MAFDQWTETDPATGAVAVYNLIAMLIAAGWTKEADSDGTTYSAGGTQVTGGGSGANGLANNSAWVRLSNPDGVEYVIQRGTTNAVWRVKMSAAAGFTGGSPGATRVPSATDEGVMLGAGSDASPTFEAWFGVDGTYRHKGGADSASPYHFWSGCFPVGGGACNHFFAHEGLEAVEPTDGSPFHALLGGNDPADSNLASETESGSSTRSWGYQAAVSPSSAGFTIVPAMLFYSLAQTAPVQLPVNPITGRDESLPIPYMRRAAISTPGWKGIGTTFRWLGTSRTNGDTFTQATARDRIVFGDISCPWQGTVPTV